jgi:nucleoside-diphosphate-sugar epimerase
MSERRVLLTGARGFIAAPALRLLVANDNAVHAISSGSPTAAHGVVWHHPTSLYGASKAAVAALLRGTTLSWAWGRVFHLYGPNEHPKKVVASVIRSLLAGREERCTSGEQQRDFLHVHDVAAAFVAALCGKLEGPFDIGAGEALPLRRILESAALAAGRPELLWLGGIPHREGEPTRVVAEGSRPRGELGWRPRCSLEEGLADAAAWWRAHAV